MDELKINVTLPDEVGVGYSELSKRARKCLHDNAMRIQCEFIKSCSENELGVLYMTQSEKDSVFEELIKRDLIARYKNRFLNKKDERVMITSFFDANYSMVDVKGKLARLKLSELEIHLKTKSVDELAELYDYLLSMEDCAENKNFIIKFMSELIIKKLDGKISVDTLNKILDADAENIELENLIKERFRLIRS